MKRILTAVIFAGMAGGVYAADFSVLQNSKASDIKIRAEKMDISVPAPAAETVKAPVTAAFKNAVKKAYEANDVSTLPVAKVSELPPAAKKQLEQDNHTWGPDYPSTPYKMTVQGKTVYIIQNENDGGMFVNIFAADGSYIDGGSCGESGTFSWNAGAPGKTAAASRLVSVSVVISVDPAQPFSTQQQLNGTIKALESFGFVLQTGPEKMGDRYVAFGQMPKANIQRALDQKIGGVESIKM